jgi:hypothetical protein
VSGGDLPQRGIGEGVDGEGQDRPDHAATRAGRRVEPADFVIAPDVTSFAISAFTRADEMAPIGEDATDASLHRLKAMLSKLDPKLSDSI